MIIDLDSFGPLNDALASAEQQGLVVNDIMTERQGITSILQGALSQIPELFGELLAGSPEEPRISKESVQYFSKTVAGQPRVRPAWFFDAKQQGEGIVDVSTHLAGLIMWQVFPDEPVDYHNLNDDVEVISARIWDTSLAPSQFNMVTNETTYPDYLAPQVENGSDLNVAANGEFVFRLRGVHCKVSVQWGFENPQGGDTHYFMMRGTRTNLVIRQDEAQDCKPTLYLEPGEETNQDLSRSIVNKALESLSDRYPGLSAKPSGFEWEIKIPEAHQERHELLFARVTQQYLQHLVDGALPAWEHTNLLTKYFITTCAYALSRREE